MKLTQSLLLFLLPTMLYPTEVVAFRIAFSTPPSPSQLSSTRRSTQRHGAVNSQASDLCADETCTQQQLQLQQQHLVLVGGGHAHVQVIKALNAGARPAHLRVTLVDAQASATYSGMAPGAVAGVYDAKETRLHLKPLAAWAGMNFVNDRVVDVDLERKLLRTQNSDNPIPFDAVSLDIGSTSRGLDDVPGARDHTIPTRPIDKMILRLDRAFDEAKEEATRGEGPRLVVVGGGAAGVELSMAIASRWKSLQPRVTVLDAGEELLPSESPAARAALQRVLREKGVEVRHCCAVREVQRGAVVLQNGGGTVPFTHAVWAAGAAAHPLARRLHSERGLAATDRGWISVCPSLQSTSHPFVFAAGDCASVEGLAAGPPPKAGVYAVRAGPVLIENLTRYLESIRTSSSSTPSSSLIRYQPQDDFLKLLACGDGKALGFRFGMPLYGKWVFQLKDRIDHNFMQLFDVSRLPPPPQPKDDGDDDAETRRNYDTAQYDAKDATRSSAPPLDPTEAALYLQRTDDDVDFELAWSVLRTMADRDDYRQAVLRHVAMCQDKQRAHA